MNVKLIREQMKFEVVIENKNASDLLRWINNMVTRWVFTMKFMLVSHNIGQKILFILFLHPLKQQLLHRQHKNFFLKIFYNKFQKI